MCKNPPCVKKGTINMSSDKFYFQGLRATENSWHRAIAVKSPAAENMVFGWKFPPLKLILQEPEQALKERQCFYSHFLNFMR